MCTLEITPRQFGNSGIEVSALGFGAGQIGADDISDHDTEVLLNECLDRGVTLIDTARGYGLSEERIGKFISHRRDEFILSTKVGYGVDGFKDWTYNSVSQGIDEALVKLKTDHIDIVHLHSCDRFVIMKPEIHQALDEAKEAGKIRLSAYSGENDHLDYSIVYGNFDSVQFSVNLFDQRSIHTLLPKAKQRGLGVIAKRPLSNAPWRFVSRPTDHYCLTYWNRMTAMNLDFDIPMLELALRFTTFIYGVDSSIVGTTKIENLLYNIDVVNKGPLPHDMVEEIYLAFRMHDDKWLGQI